MSTKAELLGQNANYDIYRITILGPSWYENKFSELRNKLILAKNQLVEFYSKKYIGHNFHEGTKNPNEMIVVFNLSLGR